MQIYSLSQLQKSGKVLLSFMLIMAFTTLIVDNSNADEISKVLDKDIQLTFNGKMFNQKQGIRFTEIKKDEANMLMIEIQSDCFDSNPKLSVFLAKGNRPIAKADVIDFSTQPGINLSSLLSQAKPGDRIVLSFNDDERIMVIPIS